MIDLPSPDSHSTVSDWVELRIAFEENSVSKAEVVRSVSLLSGSEPSEDFIDSVWQELRERQTKYRTPLFEVDKRFVNPLDTAIGHSCYQMCLILSLFGLRGVDPIASRLFEKLTSIAVKRYLSGEAITVGWPGETSTIIKSRCAEIANQLNERFVEHPDSWFKDRGIDVIAWAPFRDGRSGQVVLLIQCGAGNDRLTKKPVPLKAWEDYIHWGSPPTIGLSVPIVVPSNDWHNESKVYGILFDRVRLINLLGDEIGDAQLNSDISALVSNNLSPYYE